MAGRLLSHISRKGTTPKGVQKEGNSKRAAAAVSVVACIGKASSWQRKFNCFLLRKDRGDFSKTISSGSCFLGAFFFRAPFLEYFESDHSDPPLSKKHKPWEKRLYKTRSEGNHEALCLPIAKIGRHGATVSLFLGDLVLRLDSR